MNRYPLAKRFRRSNSNSHELQELPKKAPSVERTCYFVVFKYLACDGYQNGHGKGVPKTNCTDPLCKPKIESVPGFCPECIAISMRDDSSNDNRRKARKKAQKEHSGGIGLVSDRGLKIQYDGAARRDIREQGANNQKADLRPGLPKRTNTSSTRRSGDSSSSDSGFGGYGNSGRVRRPSNSYGGYSFNEFVTSEMKKRDTSHESDEEAGRRWSPKPASGGFRSLFKRL